MRLGAKYGPLIAAGDWWRLLTPIFLHGGLIHLAFNSIVLFDLGPAVEQIYGSHKYIVLYIVTGAAGYVVSFLWHPYSVSVGASGALMGLIGAMIAYGRQHRSRFGDSIKSMYVRWAIYGLIYGFIVPGVDNAAHLGGLGAGLLFGFIVTDMPSITRESIVFWKVLALWPSPRRSLVLSCSACGSRCNQGRGREGAVRLDESASSYTAQVSLAHFSHEN